MDLRERIELLYDDTGEPADHAGILSLIDQFKQRLNRGEIRAAVSQDGTWYLNTWVKKGILLAFRTGQLVESAGNGGTPFFDKDTMALRRFTPADGVRIVPGGSAVRDGAYIGRGVIMMPPSYVNVGAYVDGDTMIDSHVLVGSCAQIGRGVHLSAASQIGGVLEPVGSMPVVIEDDVFVGGNCGIYEGTIVRRRSVLAAGVILTGSTPVYDLVNRRIYRKSADGPLTIPEGAVVIPGNRHIQQPFAKEHHLSLYAPVIVKYRDEKTDAATVLEESLR
jgi:2,3,4,5-tetrahydropyridine-2-carboxylate N-succinyltransferase